MNSKNDYVITQLITVVSDENKNKSYKKTCIACSVYLPQSVKLKL